MKSGWTLLDFTGEIHQISGWNLVDFMKSLVIAPTLHSSNWRVFAETLAFIILGGFHRWNLGEIHHFMVEIHQISSTGLKSAFIQISGWNLGEICHWISWVKSTRFQGVIPHPAFIKLKSFCWNTCFYNFGWISQVISGWNLHWISWVKSTRFQGEILGHSPHPAFIKLKSFCWNTCFYNFGWISQVISGWNPPDFRVKSGRFHEILGHSPHPAFIKLKSFCWNTCFYNFGWISQVKSGWNPPDFRVKSGRFHEILGHSPHPAFIKLKSFCWNTCFYNFGWISQVISGWNLHWISGWNPPDFTDFMKSTRFHLKSAGFHEICQISPEIHWISWWNPPDFMDFMKSARFHGEIHWISWWNLPDFMKSAGFHERELLGDDQV